MRRVGATTLLTAVVVFWMLVHSSHRKVHISGITPAPAQPNGEPLFRVKQGKQYGFIDRTGAVVIPPQFAGAGGFSEGLAPALEGSTQRWGYIDRHGQWVVPPRFKMAADFSEGLAEVREEFQAPCGFIDRSGAWIFPPQFEAAYAFYGGRASIGRMTLIGKVKRALDADEASDWRWREIDLAGNILGPVTLDYQPEFGADGLRQVWVNRRIGFENRAGVHVIPPQFQETTGFSEGLAAVRLPGQQWGYIDRTGDWVISPRFGWSNPFRDGLAEVTVNGKAGYIDRTGNFVWQPSE